ncbi:hypothetical protein MATR_36480 [Marivirga tractuosa]|uniref:Uncharacterized protein n=1 Tax=Marivirga tractuosa (strain ATCC 23168 / DSM 4126 / NBRC 15989 / NCIMB 1408 / VKM B-1430 / H-43) TaxID=643867 RepID=E4TNU2_MARTH|nr:hypothetical protein [Marivirga tractuosa]ADR22506.1 hypothetical protein Ftrac_2528 [Marivirga tractuosa DSM 4126]BDD16823.1 hypothetical protein MATR_36480 [Marivirga tractuosa]
MLNFNKAGIIILLLATFLAFDVSAKKKEDKKKEKDKVEAEPDKKCEKTDSLSELKQRAVVQDSLNQHKSNVPSSMSSMSYNILFQVIYRYSFKEIFDSPAASDIVTN